MNTKHTPGPWTWTKDAGSNSVRVYKALNLPPMVKRRYREKPIARVALNNSIDFIADARLIAAAPEMLAALRAVKQILDDVNEDFTQTEVDLMVEKVNDAIAKSEGGK